MEIKTTNENNFTKVKLTVFMAVSKELRDKVKKEYRSLWDKYYYYTTTRSNFCPMVYGTCEYLIRRITLDGKAKEYTKLLDTIENTRRIRSQSK